MNDLISRQAAIDAIKTWGLIDGLSEGQAIEILADEEKLPTAQPEILACGKGELNVPGTNVGDIISRQAAIDAIRAMQTYKLFAGDDQILVDQAGAQTELMMLPSAQPGIIRCKDCIYYDPPHVENNGVRYEYDEMPADAFDALGTGLVNAEYGVNIGGRCCVDYYCKNYSDDKRVFVREDNYCGRAERRTDGSD